MLVRWIQVVIQANNRTRCIVQDKIAGCCVVMSVAGFTPTDHCTIYFKIIKKSRKYWIQIFHLGTSVPQSLTGHSERRNS
jgi:hypothetical protein